MGCLRSLLTVVWEKRGLNPVGVFSMNTVYWEVKESAGQSLFYRQDKMEESPGSIGQGAR